MDDMLLIDCVERIRGHLLRTDTALSGRLEALRSLSPRTVDARAAAERCFALAAGMDPDTPDGRRDAALAMVREAAEPPPRAAAPRGLPPGEAEGRAADLLAWLVCEPPLADAVARVRRVYPGLRPGVRAHEFLAAVGYPAPVPSRPQVRLAQRLGFVPADGEGADARESYLLRVQATGAQTGAGALEVDHLLALFSGARRASGVDPVCGARPACDACPVASLCENRPVAPVAPDGRGRHISIREWAEDERPRERLLHGATLTDAELVAILLRTGRRGESALDIARRLIHVECDRDVRRLGEKDPVQLAALAGLGPARAATLAAAIELGRRVAASGDLRTQLPKVGVSRAVFERCRARFMHAKQEVFLLLTLNTKNAITREVEISTGTLNASIVHPRDVFRQALMENPAGVIFVHNHPSGDPAPSQDDRNLTRRLDEAGRMLGVKVLDHVIIGSESYFSFADEGLLG